MKLKFLTISLFIFAQVTFGQTVPWTFKVTNDIHTMEVEDVADELEIGDFVGVFYDSLGTGVCAGMEEWNGSSISFPVYGESSLGARDGFVPNESFQFRVWKKGYTCILRQVTGNIPSGPNQFIGGNSSTTWEYLGSVHPLFTISSLNTSITNLTCDQPGSVIIDTSTINGGSKNFQYSLINNIEFTKDSNFTGSFTVTREGSYDIEVTDSNNCTLREPLSQSVLEDCEPQVLTPTEATDNSLYISCSGIITIQDRNGKRITSFQGPGYWDGRDNTNSLVKTSQYYIFCNESYLESVTVLK